MVRLAKCWAELPFHLLYDIIEQTTDPKTLQNWSVATKKNERLLHLVLQIQWRETCLGQNDFLSGHPGRPPLSRTKIGKITRVLYPRRRLLQPTLASYIEHLTLDFHFKSDIAREIVIQPCYEDVEAFLAALIPTLSRVSEVTFNGSLYQGILDQLLGIKSDKLQVLRLRDRFPKYLLWRTENPRLSVDDLMIYFGSLTCFKSLRVLEIRELQFSEGSSLANAVGELEQLEKLHVEATSDAGPLMMTRVSPEGWVGYGSSLRCTISPLDVFLKGVFPCATADRPIVSCTLPYKLQSLALVDSYARTVWVNDPVPLEKSYQFLTDVYIGLDQRDVVENILTWLQAPVTRLTIPSAKNLYYYPSTPKEVDPNFTTYFDRVIAKTGSLQQITLLNVWDSHLELSEDLESQCSNSFVTRELVLGTEPIQRYNYVCSEGGRYERRNDGKLDTIRRKLCGSEESDAKDNRWGSRIRRMRVENIPQSDSYFNGFANSKFDHLKVLVVALCSAHKSASEVDSDLLVERPIVEQIAAQGFLNLRIVVVRAGQYWLQRGKPTGVSSRKSVVVKIWRFSEALSDPEQRVEIERCLDDDDWKFMDGHPLHCSEPLYDIERLDAGMYARSNYIVLDRSLTEQQLEVA